MQVCLPSQMVMGRSRSEIDCGGGRSANVEVDRGSTGEGFTGVGGAKRGTP